MKLLIPTFALFLLSGGCSTITLTAALGDGTATAEDTPIVRKRNAGDANPFGAGRGSDGEGEAGDTEEPDDDDDDNDEEDDGDESRIIDVHGPLKLDIPHGRVQRLVLRQTDAGAFIQPAPRRAPRIL